MDTCTQSAAAAGEGLEGTAVDRWRWLMIEHRPAWPAQVEALGLPTARFEADGVRIQLIRQGATEGPLTAVYANVQAGVVRRFAFTHAEELATLDLETAGEPVTGPLVLVCTHGQRDTCCARLGGRVYAALRERLGDAVWQTSHLGGHRFAPTLLWLPEGYCYGRVDVADVPALVAAADRGEVLIERLRGRVSLSPRAQAAEIALRRTIGEPRVGAVSVVGEHGDVVTVRHENRAHTFAVASRTLERPVTASCGKAPGPARSWLVRPHAV